MVKNKIVFVVGTLMVGSFIIGYKLHEQVIFNVLNRFNNETLESIRSNIDKTK